MEGQLNFVTNSVQLEVASPRPFRAKLEPGFVAKFVGWMAAEMSLFEHMYFRPIFPWSFLNCPVFSIELDGQFQWANKFSLEQFGRLRFYLKWYKIIWNHPWSSGFIEIHFGSIGCLEVLLGIVSNNQNGNLRWFLPLGVEPPPPANGHNFQTFFTPLLFFCNWILCTYMKRILHLVIPHICHFFYTCKIFGE